MKIGLLAAGFGKGARPETLRMLAEHCERLNFGTLWAPEHVVLFDRQESKYPYSEDGAFAAPSTIDWMDPFIALTYAAARTSRIRLATGRLPVSSAPHAICASRPAWTSSSGWELYSKNCWDQKRERREHSLAHFAVANLSSKKGVRDDV